MSTITRPRPAVKPTPARSFGAGLADPGLEPRINLAELTEEERVMLYGPSESIPIDDEPGECSTLPAIDGSGLSRAEWFRVTGARNNAKARYARDMPEATPGEIDAVGDRAAGDALRRVLADRPAAAAIAVADPFPPDRLDPNDCPGDASTWGPETDEFTWELGPDDQGGNDEPEPERPAVERGHHFEPSTDDRVWWAQNAPSVVRPSPSKPARRKVTAPHTDREVRRLNAIG